MPTPASRQLTIKQLVVFIGPFFLASIYTTSIHRTTHPSIIDNGIKYDYSSHHNIITSHQHIKNPTIIMSDLDHDYTADDYRAFLFAQHPIHGLLLLYCSRKKNKPPHFQAPGGHVDKEDFDEALTRLQDATTSNSSVDGNITHPLLLLACKIGAARELYEETGIDLRNHLDRLQPVQLRKSENNGAFPASCVLKHRLFFKICFSDDDFETTGFDSMVALGLSQAMNTEAPMLMLKLSHEHQGFRFEPDPRRAVDLLMQHSGGKVSKALGMALAQGDMSASLERDEPDVVIGHPKSKEAMDHTGEEKGVDGVFDCFRCC